MILLVLFSVVFITPSTSQSNSAEKFYYALYAWVGSGTDGNPDYLAVIDFNKLSHTYGSIVNTVPLTNSSTRSSISNEPHHSLITKVKGTTYLVASGLLSFLQNRDDIFVWKLTNVTSPEFVASYDLPGGCADELNPFQKGVLVTMMCNDHADSPGSLVYLNLDEGTFRTITDSAQLINFNPHGFDVNLDLNITVVTDYIRPISLLYSPVFRETVRRFNLTNGRNDIIWTVPGAGGFMDFRFIQGEAAGYTCGTSSNNQLYYINATSNQPPVQTFDLRQISGGPILSAGIMRHAGPASRYLLGTYGLRYFIVFNIQNRYSPQLLFTYDFCDSPVTGNVSFNCSSDTSPGAHYVLVTEEEDRVVVVLYFLKFGVLIHRGACTIAVFNTNFKVSPPIITFDSTFQLNMYPDKPHSIKALKQKIL